MVMPELIVNNQPELTSLAYRCYYALGLRQVLGSRVRGVVPGFLRPLSRFRMPAMITAMTERLAVNRHGFCASHDPHVSQYLWVDPGRGRRVKFAVDVHDNKAIRSSAILAWSDLYFKSNKWNSVAYSDKILPIVNGCRLSEGEIRSLSSLRHVKKEYDLAFVARVWGGPEHSVRMFEQLARLDCKKQLLAILVPKASPEGRRQNQEYVRRLEAANVPWVSESEDGLLPRRRLWEWYAKSSLVVIRCGKHLSMPWRMIETLCLGACIVYDMIPQIHWPISLEPNAHYLTLSIPLLVEGSAAPLESYERIPELISGYLADPSLQEHIREGSRGYFDRAASPAMVATYILSSIERTCELSPAGLKAA